MEAVILLPSYYKADSYHNVLNLIDSLEHFRNGECSYKVLVYLQNYPSELSDRICRMIDQDDFIKVISLCKDPKNPKSFTNREIRHKAYELAQNFIIDPYYKNQPHGNSIAHNLAIIHIDDDFLFNRNSVQYYDKAVNLVRNPEIDCGLVKVNNRKKDHPDGSYTDEFLWTSAGLVHYDDGEGIFEDPILDMKMGADDLAIYLKFIKRGSTFTTVNGADIINQPDLLNEGDDNIYSDPSDKWRESGNHEIIEHYMNELGLDGDKCYSIQNHKLISINFIHKYLGLDTFIDSNNRELLINE